MIIVLKVSCLLSFSEKALVEVFEKDQNKIPIIGIKVDKLRRFYIVSEDQILIFRITSSKVDAIVLQKNSKD